MAAELLVADEAVSAEPQQTITTDGTITLPPGVIDDFRQDFEVRRLRKERLLGLMGPFASMYGRVYHTIVDSHYSGNEAAAQLLRNGVMGNFVRSNPVDSRKFGNVMGQIIAVQRENVGDKMPSSAIRPLLESLGV